ncbi:MAG TPA: molybdopterin-binding protein [Candidatus Limnocylindrales bacterium]|nr:molybdopterin-binding protein [Candidatus Limnocylindrales bacterium]
MVPPPPRPLRTAELLSIGSELTVGETRDTNAGDLARSLTGLGIAVRRIQALPDDLVVVSAAFADAAASADLVVSTGGLGPTPDDLTREAIAAAVGEEPAVDPDLERWLRELWDRRGMPFPAMNLKQAWLLPSATALPNPNGTAPGWWVARPDGGLIVALPGPPREMRPMWTDHVVPALRQHGIGASVASRTLRLAGIGESQVADLLGEDLLRASDPIVATYARADAVDVRISARDASDEVPAAGRAAADRVAATAARIAPLLGGHVWSEGETSWADAIEAALAARGQTLAILEIGTAGSLAALLGDRDRIRFSEALASETSTAQAHASAEGLEHLTRRAAELGGSAIAIGVRARPRGGDTAVSVVVVSPDWTHRERRIVFLGGSNGRTRAALAAAHILLTAIRAH